MIYYYIEGLGAIAGKIPKICSNITSFYDNGHESFFRKCGLQKVHIPLRS